MNRLRSLFITALLAQTGLMGCDRSTAPHSDVVDPVVSLSLGTNHSCAINLIGVAMCWGANDKGQLGNGATDFSQRSVPDTVGTALFKSLGAGTTHSCGLSVIGTLYCWGYEFYGALGDGIEEDPTARSRPLPVFSSDRYSAVAAGTNSSCGISDLGEVRCWGQGLGLGSTPVGLTAATGYRFTGLAVGRAHGCAIATGGPTYCWGENGSGQLGTGTTEGQSFFLPSGVTSATVIAVAGAASFKAITAGGDVTCGVTSAGAAWCWGNNASGQLGNGTVTTRLAPTLVSDTLRFTGISAGANHFCAITVAGDAMCWGDNARGQLGAATTGSFSATPVLVSGGKHFTGIAAGGQHSCGLEVGATHAVYCWGANGSGEIGDGTTIDRPTPTLVVGLEKGT